MTPEELAAAVADLLPKQRRFIDKYFECGMNQSKAALLAGYSVRQSGAENMANPVIKAEINRRLDEMAMGAQEVLARLAAMGRGDMREFIGLLPSDLKAHPDGGLIRKYKHTVTRMKKDPASEIFEWDETVEIELYDAQSALNTLAKHHKLLTEKIDHTTGGKPLPGAYDLSDEELARIAAGRGGGTAGEAASAD